ncbi:MAG: DNA mismatch repair endonuclease MutL [Prosthecobacter sp.]|uniref:DNA mismatch repair endonuclease MutL n=1 Tax=Prosthecobacter sp. TaxID=1965333 RepID=UPI0025EEBBC0|nr:DNA mismatch repair endonuclease MutL [Prosthecobacter sp.]MCF7785972.1 DNA mismatch repair endonuclease MutL [Prosthecobacter sp.]
MAKIRILPDALASQVAAGEVVERPAALVRELVENSLDAGAHHIEVHAQRGGIAMIRIVDDGSGMDREDAMLCLERHATSKIRTKEDLGAIHTFGFRGEALPSIASVSRFRLATREKSALVGTEIEVNGGKLVAVRDHGGAPGTVIEARSLFFNVPARRKFLRTENTEFAHVEQQLRLHAIANPQTAFTLTHNGELVLHLPATRDMLERIRGMVGDELASRLLKVEETTVQGVTVSGYIGGPGMSRSNRQMQTTYLNGRPIESASISYGLREGYHTALMKGQYPVTFLFIQMDPHAFDVNVHPAKKEVRFHDGHSVRDAISRSVSHTLENAAKLPTGHAPARAIPAAASTQAVPSSRQEQFAMPVPASSAPLRNIAPAPAATSAPRTQPFAPAVSHRAADVLARIATERSTPAIEPQAPEAAAPPEAQEEEVEAPQEPQAPAKAAPSEPPEYRIIGVLQKLYVLMEGKEGLVLMDQHAAHERVNFEKFRRAIESGGVPCQRLLLPVTLQTTPRDADLLKQNMASLNRLGIEIEPFGPNIFKVETLPAFLKTDDPAAWLDQVIEELSSLSTKSSSLRLSEDAIATIACRASVKSNDVLSIPEMQALLKDLFACEMPYCCPHGRPTLVQISTSELERKFGRRAPG